MSDARPDTTITAATGDWIARTFRPLPAQESRQLMEALGPIKPDSTAPIYRKPMPQYARQDAVWLFEDEVDLLRRHRAARPYDADGVHFQSRICDDCGWELPIAQRHLTGCPHCRSENLT